MRGREGCFKPANVIFQLRDVEAALEDAKKYRLTVLRSRNRRSSLACSACSSGVAAVVGVMF